MGPAQARAWNELVEAERAREAAERALEAAREHFAAVTRRERHLRLVKAAGDDPVVSSAPAA